MYIWKLLKIDLIEVENRTTDSGIWESCGEGRNREKLVNVCMSATG
jgi:hypothetical protein